MTTRLTCLDWIRDHSVIADTVVSRQADVVDLATIQVWEGAARVRGVTGHCQALEGHSLCCEAGATFSDIPVQQSGGRTVLCCQMLRNTRTCNDIHLSTRYIFYLKKYNVYCVKFLDKITQMISICCYKL